MEGEHLVDHFGTTGQAEQYQICTRTLHTGAQLGICCYVETDRYIYSCRKNNNPSPSLRVSELS